MVGKGNGRKDNLTVHQFERETCQAANGKIQQSGLVLGRGGHMLSWFPPSPFLKKIE